MKWVFLLFCTLSIMFHVHAQDVSKRNAVSTDVSCPKAFFGLSTGVNNPNGVLGFNVAIPIKSLVSVGGGIGVSTWGNKIFAEGRYYLRPCQRGFAFAGGVTHNTGRQHATLKHQETDLGKQDVTLNLSAQTNAYIAVYHFWNLGKHHNRFYVDGGYSVPLQTARFRQVFPPPATQTQPQGYLTDGAKNKIRYLSPGGIMVGVGFCFGLK